MYAKAENFVHDAFHVPLTGISGHVHSQFGGMVF